MGNVLCGANLPQIRWDVPGWVGGKRVHLLFYTRTHTHIPNMVKSTIIARVSDGLPLAASMDDEQVRVT